MIERKVIDELAKLTADGVVVLVAALGEVGRVVRTAVVVGQVGLSVHWHWLRVARVHSRLELARVYVVQTELFILRIAILPKLQTHSTKEDIKKQ